MSGWLGSRGAAELSVFFLCVLGKLVVFVSWEILENNVNIRNLHSFTSIFQRVLFKPKEWYMGTPYHLFSTLWKIQVV